MVTKTASFPHENIVSALALRSELAIFPRVAHSFDIFVTENDILSGEPYHFDTKVA
jgi:hypothetical protein